MPSINRATLPQNFLDSVSMGLRLPTPEPQYLFAQMAMGARMSLAAIDAGASTVQQFVSMAAEVPVVLDQFEGPYNTDGSEVRPYAILDFDAKYRANKDQLAGLTTLHL